MSRLNMIDYWLKKQHHAVFILKFKVRLTCTNVCRYIEDNLLLQFSLISIGVKGGFMSEKSGGFLLLQFLQTYTPKNHPKICIKSRTWH